MCDSRERHKLCALPGMPPQRNKQKAFGLPKLNHKINIYIKFAHLWESNQGQFPLIEEVYKIWDAEMEESFHIDQPSRAALRGGS